MRACASFAVTSMLCVGALSCSSSKAPEGCTPTFPTQTVDLKDFAFEPACIGAPRGTHIALQNTGAATHTFTVTGTPIDQEIAAGAGGEVSVAGVAPGTYQVVCTIHPQMTATLVVT